MLIFEVEVSVLIFFFIIIFLVRRVWFWYVKCIVLCVRNIVVIGLMENIMVLLLFVICICCGNVNLLLFILSW